MKRDTEIIKDILLWLLSDPDSGPAADTTEAASPWIQGTSEAAIIDGADEVWDPLESAAFEMIEPDPELWPPGTGTHPISQLGEIPAVQDRFQALIKRRLRLEIERRPPLFPWEKEVQEYPEWLSGETAAPPIWLNQLQTLKLPARLPDTIMLTLLERCQTLAQQSLKSGIRLIKAVEALFPDQPQALELVARLVLTPAYRSGSNLSTPSLDYDTANPQQQIALTMLAAQEIFASLSLTVSPQAPTTQRQWITPTGSVTLTATYHPGSPDQIHIQSTVPEAGYLALIQGEQVLRADATQPGALTVILEAPHPQQSYCLELGLSQDLAHPLRFVLAFVETP